MKSKIIISVYNEDLSWTDSINRDIFDILIYNKGSSLISVPDAEVQALKNYGKDSESFLRYICDNYGNFPEFSIFLQGNPFDHCSFHYKKCQNKLFAPFDLNKLIFEGPSKCEIISSALIREGPDSDYHCKAFTYQHLFFKNWLDYFDFGAGSQYCVKPSNIMSRSLEFWEILHSFHKTHPPPVLGSRKILVLFAF